MTFMKSITPPSETPYPVIDSQVPFDVVFANLRPADYLLWGGVTVVPSLVYVVWGISRIRY